MQVYGQNFTKPIINKIQAMVKADPSITRRELSRRICELNDWIPVAGDWNGNGQHSVALYEPGDGNFHTYDHGVIRFGPKGENWTPVTGDWNGDGKHGVGLHYDGHFHLDESAGLEAPYRFGPRGDTDWLPVSGKW